MQQHLKQNFDFLRFPLQDGGGQCFYSEINYHSNIVFYFITVLDVPDLDPKFLGLPYIGSVDENSAVVSSCSSACALSKGAMLSAGLYFIVKGILNSNLKMYLIFDRTILFIP